MKDGSSLIEKKLARGIIKLSKGAVAAKNSYILACRDFSAMLAENTHKARKIQKNHQLQGPVSLFYVHFPLPPPQTKRAD